MQTNNKGFTLLELLIVIGVLSILSVIVVLVLNPAETLKKARDSQRMADLNTIKTSIGLFVASTGTPYLGLNGTSNTGCGTGASHYVWYSKVGVTDITLDTTANTAASAASQSAAGSVNGSGWIPVNLANLSGGSPISNWPIDPSNSIADLANVATSDLVYRYGCASANTTFEVNARLESDAYTVQDNKMTSDGGNNNNLYEVGTALNVLGTGTDL